jgi:erythromycin esterase-like protein
MASPALARAVANAAIPLKDGSDRFDALMARVGDASLVLLGEATHGSHEFYAARAEITQRLIREKGFDAIAVEADWPDALRASRYVQGANRDTNATEALRDFERFPRWMWRNTEVRDFIEALRCDNLAKAGTERIGFYGLDLYSLRSSMDAVLRYLAKIDVAAEKRARQRYGCFDHVAEDPQRYGYVTTFGMTPSCEQETLRQLAELTRDATRFLEHDGPAAEDELFYAQQNARVAANAEAYYRSMFRGRSESWNRRDSHMAETLQALIKHLSERRGRPAKIVVWAHNSHLGDARATQMGDTGQLNLGQLVRENFDAKSLLVGFTTHTGSVTAASEWDEPAELKRVRPSHPDSFERLFHEVGIPEFLIAPAEVAALRGVRMIERAIGVIYLPHSERLSHYFDTTLARQFDVVIHIDRTRALEPLDPSHLWKHSDAPEEVETWPSGM